MSDPAGDSFLNSRKFPTMKNDRLAKILKKFQAPINNSENLNNRRYCIRTAKDEAGIGRNAFLVIACLMISIQIILYRLALLHIPLHFLSVLHLRKC